jgi:hypothetical protein
MKKNKLNILEQDKDLLNFYFDNDKCILLDARINEIIDSGDKDRIKGISIVFEPHKNDKKLDSLLYKIEKILKTNMY